MDSDTQKYRVTFLIAKTIEVEELDEIQAETAAAAQLPPAERRQVEMIRVEGLYGNSTIDKEWWANKGLL